LFDCSWAIDVSKSSALSSLKESRMLEAFLASVSVRV
jgi:hypothetical protein